MKDTLISFETAKLAKAKGFDIPTIEGYREGGTFCDGKGFMANLKKYSAPNQSLLQKWLREKHNEIILILPDGDKFLPVSHTGLGLTEISTLRSFLPWDSFDKYEDALEEGLKGGLKNLSDVS